MSSACAHSQLPDIALPLAEGGTASLHSFCGQKLALIVCPARDEKAAAAEIEAYDRLASNFERAGAWILAIVASPAHLSGPANGPHIHLAVDADGAIFRALLAYLSAPPPANPEDGLTLVIDRDGTVRDAWPGCGHALQALASARERP